MSLSASVEDINALVAKGEHYEALQLYMRLIKGLEQKGDEGQKCITLCASIQRLICSPRVDSLKEAASIAEGSTRTMMRYV
jgi:hypothetical protein